MNENEQKQQGLQIELTPDKAQGEYANFAIITHSSSEFIVDFARMLPGLPKAQVRSRVILAPEHAERLLGACRRTSCAMSASLDRLKCPNRSRAAPSLPSMWAAKVKHKAD